MSKNERRMHPTSAGSPASPKKLSINKPPQALSEQQPPSPSPPNVTQIATPQRERGRPLYPTTLAKSSQGPGGRVPLHRRGTSRTYERLEDLLREAGYKETRVFTPENERFKGVEADEDDDGRRKQERKRSNVAVVVDFLSNLIPALPGVASTSSGSSANTSTSLGTSFRSQSQSTGETSISEHKPLHQNAAAVIRLEDDLWTPPSPSPRTHTQRRIGADRMSKQIPIQQQRRESQQSILFSGTIRAHLSPSMAGNAPIKRSPALDSLRKNSAAMVSTTSLRSDVSLSNSPSRSHPNISNLAGNNAIVRQNSVEASHAPLRHMASAPSIPRSKPRPHKQIRRLTNADSTTNAPPLPTNWLFTVAKAVLNAGSGDTGVYMGGPSRLFSASSTSIASSAQERGRLSRANSERERGRASGRGRLGQVHGHAKFKGPLLNEEELKRLRPAPLVDMKGVVGATDGVSMVTATKVNVVCRSAPASRTASRVRGGNNSRNQSRIRARTRNPREDRDRLPSLGVTTVERGADPTLLASLLLALPHANEGAGIHDDDESSSEEEEGDLNLAKLLVPSKRQRSIASLRRSLWGGVAISPGSAMGSRAPSRPQSRQGHANSHRPYSVRDGTWTHTWQSTASASTTSLSAEHSRLGLSSVPPSPNLRHGRHGEAETNKEGIGRPPGLRSNTPLIPEDLEPPSRGSSSNLHSRAHSRQNSVSVSLAPSSKSIAKADPDPDDSFAQALERDFQRQRRGSIDNDEDELRDLERLGLPGFDKAKKAAAGTVKKRGAIPGWLWS